jgi:hypothetical protein
MFAGEAIAAGAGTPLGEKTVRSESSSPSGGGLPAVWYGSFMSKSAGEVETQLSGLQANGDETFQDSR